MKPTLWFAVPAHGRFRLSQICLRQLRRTCDALTSHGIEASAVVIACDENLDTARELGFATIERGNDFLSQRYNDGIQLACDPAHNPRPVDYVVPCGSDDWVHHRIFLELPYKDTILGFQRMCFVREDGLEMTARHLNYMGGCGIRIYPAQVVARLGYRPADEDRQRGCDTSILTNIQMSRRVQVTHREIDPRLIVDWKTNGEQLNSFESLRRHRAGDTTNPYEALAGIYPAEALEEMAAHYGVRDLVAA